MPIRSWVFRISASNQDSPSRAPPRSSRASCRLALRTSLAPPAPAAPVRSGGEVAHPGVDQHVVQQPELRHPPGLETLRSGTKSVQTPSQPKRSCTVARVWLAIASNSSTLIRSRPKSSTIGPQPLVVRLADARVALERLRKLSPRAARCRGPACGRSNRALHRLAQRHHDPRVRHRRVDALGGALHVEVEGRASPTAFSSSPRQKRLVRGQRCAPGSGEGCPGRGSRRSAAPSGAGMKISGCGRR